MFEWSIRSPDVVRSEVIKKSRHRGLFHPDFLLGYNQSCKSNFFEGSTQAVVYKAREGRNLFGVVESSLVGVE